LSIKEASMKINITSLLKARDVFENFRKNLNTDQEKAGAVQAFESCYELSWKTMKRVLSFRGVEVTTPRDTFREAALAKLIENPEDWFDFIRKRNLTVHTYDQENLQAIVAILDVFSRELHKLIENLEKVT